MKKYDCSKSKDLIHELNRMCSSIKNCCNCPLNSPFYHCFMEANKIPNDVITIVQKWSDENPEKYKLTRKEYDFIKMFTCDRLMCKIYRRSDGRLILFKPAIGFELDRSAFPFIKESEFWSLEELLKLEVEE